MKLLFDQNISYKIIKKLSEIFPECNHVTSLKLTNATDNQIWTFAKDNDYAIVTFDSDFLNLAALHGAPPKIILLKIGNKSTSQIATVLEEHAQIIFQFISDMALKEIACLEINEALGTTWV